MGKVPLLKESQTLTCFIGLGVNDQSVIEKWIRPNTAASLGFFSSSTYPLLLLRHQFSLVEMGRVPMKSQYTFVESYVIQTPLDCSFFGANHPLPII